MLIPNPSPMHPNVAATPINCIAKSLVMKDMMQVIRVIDKVEIIDIAATTS
jgi:hypothetical protein